MPRWNRELVGIVIVAFLLRVGVAIIFPMGAKYDLVSYRLVGEAVLNGENVYQVLPDRYPYFPGWMLIEALAKLVADSLGIPFWLVIRLPQIAADATIVVVIYEFIKQNLSESDLSPLQGAAFHTFNPAAIAVIGGHGQFDSLPILALILSIGFVLLGRDDLSAVVLGLGIALIFMGLLLLGYLSNTRSRIRYFLLAAAPTAILSIPFLLLSPVAYIQSTLGYSSGALMSWLTPLLLVEAVATPPGAALGIPFPNIPQGVILTITKFGYLASVLVVSWLFWKKDRYGYNISLWSASLLIVLLFYTISAALAAQYPYWAMPFLPLVSLSNRYRIGLMFSGFAVSALWYTKSYALSGEITFNIIVLSVYGLFV
ncbi:MAG: hypothetical protein ABEI86_05350, partial [Halobacteriaceae archaeon]